MANRATKLQKNFLTVATNLAKCNLKTKRKIKRKTRKLKTKFAKHKIEAVFKFANRKKKTINKPIKIINRKLCPNNFSFYL